MNDKSDSQLLHEYAGNRTEAAFTELVNRHVDFVYSAALRMVRDSHLAEDVAQGVFVALGRNAAQLTERVVISGWLHRTAQNIAAQTVRTIERRRAREQEAAAMNQILSAEPDAGWQQIAPHLDDALGELSEPDRDILLLSYFEGKSAREMAQILGISSEAAQKSVSRAVERLREFFAKRGVTVGASGLAVVISANAVQAAPVGLALTISTAAALTGTTLATAIKTIAMTTLQKTAITATLAVVAGVGIYEARQNSQLRAENQKLHQQQAPLAEQIQQVQRGYEDATNRLAALREDNERLNRNTAELLKLRNEVTQLRPLRKDVAELKTLASQSAANFGEWLPNQFTNAGRATPQDALQTLFWSGITTNFPEMRNCLIGDPNDSPTEAAINEFANNSLLGIATGVSKIKVLSQILNSTDEVQIEVQMRSDQAGSQVKEGFGVSGMMILRKVGGEWKFVLCPTRDRDGQIVGVDIANKSSAR